MTELLDEPDILESLQRTEFDNESRTAITSTDVPKILGLTKWGTPLSVYLDKRGEGKDRALGLPAWIGMRLENLVAELYTSATGTPLRTDDGFYRHPQNEWLGTHLDRRAVGDGRLIVELKTRNSARGWGEDGSADIPADVWTQVQIQAAVVGAREVHVATLFSNSSFRVYRIMPDPEFMATILPVLATLWFDHIQAGVPPLATGGDVDHDIVATGGGDTGVIKAATPEQEQLVAQYVLAHMNAAQAELAESEAKNRIMQIIGPDADGLRGSFGLIMWRRTKPVTKTNWKLVATVYRNAVDALLELASPGTEDDNSLNEYATIQAEVELAESLYSETKEGSRVFRPSLNEE